MPRVCRDFVDRPRSDVGHCEKKLHKPSSSGRLRSQEIFCNMMAPAIVSELALDHRAADDGSWKAR